MMYPSSRNARNTMTATARHVSASTTCRRTPASSGWDFSARRALSTVRSADCSLPPAVAAQPDDRGDATSAVLAYQAGWSLAGIQISYCKLQNCSIESSFIAKQQAAEHESLITDEVSTKRLSVSTVIRPPGLAVRNLPAIAMLSRPDLILTQITESTEFPPLAQHRAPAPTLDRT